MLIFLYLLIGTEGTDDIRFCFSKGDNCMEQANCEQKDCPKLHIISKYNANFSRTKDQLNAKDPTITDVQSYIFDEKFHFNPTSDETIILAAILRAFPISQRPFKGKTIRFSHLVTTINKVFGDQELARLYSGATLAKVIAKRGTVHNYWRWLDKDTIQILISTEEIEKAACGGRFLNRCPSKNAMPIGMTCNKHHLPYSYFHQHIKCFFNKRGDRPILPAGERRCHHVEKDKLHYDSVDAATMLSFHGYKSTIERHRDAFKKGDVKEQFQCDHKGLGLQTTYIAKFVGGNIFTATAMAKQSFNVTKANIKNIMKTLDARGVYIQACTAIQRCVIIKYKVNQHRQWFWEFNKNCIRTKPEMEVDGSIVRIELLKLSQENADQATYLLVAKNVGYYTTKSYLIRRLNLIFNKYCQIILKRETLLIKKLKEYDYINIQFITEQTPQMVKQTLQEFGGLDIKQQSYSDLPSANMGTTLISETNYIAKIVKEVYQFDKDDDMVEVSHNINAMHLQCPQWNQNRNHQHQIHPHRMHQPQYPKANDQHYHHHHHQHQHHSHQMHQPQHPKAHDQHFNVAKAPVIDHLPKEFIDGDHYNNNQEQRPQHGHSFPQQHHQHHHQRQQQQNAKNVRENHKYQQQIRSDENYNDNDQRGDDYRPSLAWQHRDHQPQQNKHSKSDNGPQQNRYDDYKQQQQNHYHDKPAPNQNHNRNDRRSGYKNDNYNNNAPPHIDHARSADNPPEPDCLVCFFPECGAKFAKAHQDAYKAHVHKHVDKLDQQQQQQSEQKETKQREEEQKINELRLELRGITQFRPNEIKVLSQLHGGVVCLVQAIEVKEEDGYVSKRFVTRGNFAVECPFKDWNQARNMMVKEAKLMKNMNHENVIKLIGVIFDVSKNHYAILIPRCKCNLHDVLFNAGEGEAAKINYNREHDLIAQISKGLEYIHYMGIIHRDLKPRNILIDNQGCVKICDFGMSRPLASFRAASMSVRGTPIYHAPELLNIAHKLRYDETTDVYALAIVIWEIKTRIYNIWIWCDRYSDQQDDRKKWDKIYTDIKEKNVRLPFYNGTQLLFKNTTNYTKWIKLIQAMWNADPSKRPSMKQLTRAILKL